MRGFQSQRVVAVAESEQPPELKTRGIRFVGCGKLKAFQRNTGSAVQVTDRHEISVPFRVIC